MLEPESPTTFGALLRRHRLAAGLTQAALAERAGVSARAIQHLERGLGQPYRTTVSRLAAALLLDDGQRAELDAVASPRPRRRAVSRRAAPTAIRLVAPRGIDSDPAAGAVSQLPIPLTSFVGRERELDGAGRLLSRARLVTLTGAGGCGKTRLALELAAQLRGELDDRVCVVGLAALHDAALVLPAIGRAFGIQNAGQTPISERLASSLGADRWLLVLDNFEQVADAAPAIVELLEACPGLVTLVTSRAALRVRGEHELEIPPLEVPGPDARPTPELVARYPAVALFVDRVTAVAPDFALMDENAAAVAEICRRLDGLPLAIELAAARMKLLTPRALLTRLDHRLPLLTGGARDLPLRLRTMRDAIAWSYQLLDESERQLFRRLGVFVGGFDLSAGSSVMGDGESGGSHPFPITDALPPSTLDLVASLVDKSLLRRSDLTSDEPRFSMLETIREYALEQLEASGEAPLIRRRHAEYYLALAEASEPELTGPKQAAWLARLEQEHANLRAVLRWLRDQGDVDWIGLRLAAVLWRFWWQRSYFTEGRVCLRALLDAAGDAAPAAVRARALHALGELTFRQGACPDARAPLEAALAIHQQSGDRLGAALALRSLGRLALEEGRNAEARAFLEKALRIERELAHRAGLPWTLSYLGWLAIIERDYPRAVAYLEEGIGLCRQLGDREGVGRHLFLLAHVALDGGDAEVARRQFVESLSIVAELRYRYGLAAALQGLADVAMTEGDSVRGLRLAGAVAALHELTGSKGPTDFRARHAAHVARARSALPANLASAVWEEGQAMGLDKSIAYALAAGAR